ncbi:MAG: caspase family protein, partial [Methylococcaceae bacterium]
MKNRFRTKTLILLSTLSLLSASGLVMAKENKVALVIGNKSYKDVPLKNSVNDAKDMKTALEKAGFTVIYAIDANQKKMDEAREKFVNALTKDSIGLFYYSGHGVQADGVNYLIPIDAN